MNILDWQYLERDNLNNIIDLLKINDELKIELLKDTTKNENILQSSVNEIRNRWINKITSLTSIYNLSPWLGQIPKGIDGMDIMFTYETLINDECIANLFNRDINNLKRIYKTTFYNSGMAAIRGTIDIINSFIKSKINISSCVGYFETRVYLETLINSGLRNDDCEVNIFIYEPIKYVVGLEISNLDKLVMNINLSKAHVKFVIIDSTMHCTTNFFEYLEFHITNNSNVIYIDIRSGIKMDQLGLEIANLGIVTWYVSNKNMSYAKYLFEYIDRYKGLVGDNISYNKLVAISKFSYKISKEYSKCIHNIVKDFYNDIDITSNKYINSILYPTFEVENEQLSMPFIFVKFTIELKEEYETLLNNIIELCKERNLFLPYRNSFGFRFPSIEFICDFISNECVMKISLGVYKGLVYESLLEIINELGNNKNSYIKSKLIKNIKRWEENE